MPNTQLPKSRAGGQGFIEVILSFGRGCYLKDQKLKCDGLIGGRVDGSTKRVLESRSMRPEMTVF